MKAVVEAWQERRRGAAKPTEDSVPEKTGRGRGQASKSQGRDRSPDQDVKASAKGGSSRRRSRNAAESITLDDIEQAEIAMEAGKVKAALSGKEAIKTETPGEPDVSPSIEQAEEEVAEALKAAAGQESEDKPALETEEASFTEPSIQSSPGTADAPVSRAPASSGSMPLATGADAEIARLRVHVEDLRRENGMLWD